MYTLHQVGDMASEMFSPRREKFVVDSLGLDARFLTVGMFTSLCVSGRYFERQLMAEPGR